MHQAREPWPTGVFSAAEYHPHCLCPRFLVPFCALCPVSCFAVPCTLCPASRCPVACALCPVPCALCQQTRAHGRAFGPDSSKLTRRPN
eukprot:363312-Chlamydomonas_euryale.AAC.4